MRSAQLSLSSYQNGVRSWANTCLMIEPDASPIIGSHDELRCWSAGEYEIGVGVTRYPAQRIGELLRD